MSADTERGLTSAEAAARLVDSGPNEVPEARKSTLLLFVRKFWGLSAWMIEGIVVLSWILHKRADASVGLGLLFVNATLSFLQEQRASAAVAALRSKLHVTSRVLRDGAWVALAARELVPGDVVRVRAGDFVPADLVVLTGSVRADQSALTGESAEIEKRVDDAVYSGSMVRRGELTARVTATGRRTFYGRTTELVERARPKLHVEAVVSRVEAVVSRMVRWLLPIGAILFVLAGASVFSLVVNDWVKVRLNTRLAQG